MCLPPPCVPYPHPYSIHLSPVTLAAWWPIPTQSTAGSVNFLFDNRTKGSVLAGVGLQGE